MFQVKGIILGPDYLLRKHAIYNGKVQNMDPLHGLGSWTPNHGPGPWTPYFYKLRLHHKLRFDDL